MSARALTTAIGAGLALSMLAGCAEPTSTLFLATGASVAAVSGTELSPVDRAASYITGKNCNLRMMEANGRFCRDHVEVGEDSVYCFKTLGGVDCHADPRPFGENWRSLGDRAATGRAISAGSVTPTPPAPEPPPVPAEAKTVDETPAPRPAAMNTGEVSVPGTAPPSTPAVRSTPSPSPEPATPPAQETASKAPTTGQPLSIRPASTR